MKHTTRGPKLLIFIGLLLLISAPAMARTSMPGQLVPADTLSSATADTLRTADYAAGYAAGYADGFRAGRGERPGMASLRSPLVHRIGAQFRPEWIVPTNPFLRGHNLAGKDISLSVSAHLRYAFGFMPGSRSDCIYGGAYQGIGIAHYRLGNSAELGDPTAVYLFQGARIARIAPHLSLNYEWNFGLSFGWHPYAADNPTNIMIGSKMNALLNVNFYFNYTFARHFDLTAGLSLTHFSNGNTKIPNAGMNALGPSIGLNYNFGRADDVLLRPSERAATPLFPRHVSYDVVLFGSWRRKGVEIGDRQIASPDAYTVLGFNFTPMYNFGYKFRAGLSVDGVYDGSANVYTEDYIVSEGGHDPGYTFYKPSIDRQLTLGLSARAEFVMPYFAINVGLGVNVLHQGGDLKSFYQILALKIAATRSSFIHIGYCLKDFHTPNFLMLGVGYRFNNKYPRLR